MCQSHGPQDPQPLLVVPGHTTLGEASSLESIGSQTLASIPLILRWPLVARLPSSVFPGFSKVVDLEDPSIVQSPGLPQAPGWIRFLALGTCHGAGFYTQKCADHTGPQHVPAKTYKPNAKAAWNNDMTLLGRFMPRYEQRPS